MGIFNWAKKRPSLEQNPGDISEEDSYSGSSENSSGEENSSYLQNTESEVPRYENRTRNSQYRGQKGSGYLNYTSSSKGSKNGDRILETSPSEKSSKASSKSRESGNKSFINSDLETLSKQLSSRIDNDNYNNRSRGNSYQSNTRSSRNENRYKRESNNPYKDDHSSYNKSSDKALYFGDTYSAMVENEKLQSLIKDELDVLFPDDMTMITDVTSVSRRPVNDPYAPKNEVQRPSKSVLNSTPKNPEDFIYAPTILFSQDIDHANFVDENNNTINKISNVPPKSYKSSNQSSQRYASIMNSQNTLSPSYFQNILDPYSDKKKNAWNEESLSGTSVIDRFSQATNSKFEKKKNSELPVWVSGSILDMTIGKTTAFLEPTNDYMMATGVQVQKIFKDVAPGTELDYGLNKASLHFPDAYQNIEIRIVAVAFRSWDSSSLKIWSNLFDIITTHSNEQTEIAKLRADDPGISIGILDPLDRLSSTWYSLHDAKESTANFNRKALFGGSKYRVQLPVERSIFVPLDAPLSGVPDITVPLDLDLLLQSSSNEALAAARFQIPIQLRGDRWHLSKAEIVKRGVIKSKPGGSVTEANVKTYTLYRADQVLPIQAETEEKARLLEDLNSVGKVYLRLMQITEASKDPRTSRLDTMRPQKPHAYPVSDGPPSNFNKSGVYENATMNVQRGKDLGNSQSRVSLMSEKEQTSYASLLGSSGRVMGSEGFQSMGEISMGSEGMSSEGLKDGVSTQGRKRNESSIMGSMSNMSKMEKSYGEDASELKTHASFIRVTSSTPSVTLSEKDGATETQNYLNTISSDKKTLNFSKTKSELKETSKSSQNTQNSDTNSNDQISSSKSIYKSFEEPQAKFSDYEQSETSKEKFNERPNFKAMEKMTQTDESHVNYLKLKGTLHLVSASQDVSSSNMNENKYTGIEQSFYGQLNTSHTGKDTFKHQSREISDPNDIQVESNPTGNNDQNMINRVHTHQDRVNEFDNSNRNTKKLEFTYSNLTRDSKQLPTKPKENKDDSDGSTPNDNINNHKN